MVVELSVPSKTFLVGEYAVLKGAPALIAATQPLFHFRAEKSQVEESCPFHPESPAGRWYRLSEVLLRDWRITFDDPHGGRGGFGASGAQFVFLHALTTYLQAQSLQDAVADVWQDYRACDRSGGSGADVVAQTLGGISYFSPEPLEAESYDWPFDETDFAIVRTGDKLATHSHLVNLRLPDLADLITADHRAVDAFFTANVEAFVSEISNFQRELKKCGLQPQACDEKLEMLNSCPGVLVSKGCGAMGAETLLAIIDHDFRSEFFAEARRLGLHVAAASTDLTAAPRLRVN